MDVFSTPKMLSFATDLLGPIDAVPSGPSTDLRPLEESPSPLDA